MSPTLTDDCPASASRFSSEESEFPSTEEEQLVCHMRDNVEAFQDCCANHAQLDAVYWLSQARDDLPDINFRPSDELTSAQKGRLTRLLNELEDENEDFPDCCQMHVTHHVVYALSHERDDLPTLDIEPPISRNQD